MKLPKIINDQLPVLNTVCKQYKVKELYIFGSAVSNRFDSAKSDLDFLVILEPMPPLEKGQTLLDLWSVLEDIFNRKVDLLSDQPIKNPILRNNIDRTKQLIYDRTGEKAPV